MGLNIKNEETHRLIQELAQLTGESMTGAVTQAVRERLQRLRDGKGDLSEALLAIGRDCTNHLTERGRTIDHGELLYDDLGLPR